MTTHYPTKLPNLSTNTTANSGFEPRRRLPNQSFSPNGGPLFFWADEHEGTVHSTVLGQLHYPYELVATIMIASFLVLEDHWTADIWKEVLSGGYA